MPFKTGQKPWNKGISYQPKNMDGLKARHGKDENHPNWKGDDASYSAIHYWVRSRKGKATKCEDCGKEGRCHWANISGDYLRDVDDYKSLCPGCHLKFDGLKMIPQRGCVNGL